MTDYAVGRYGASDFRLIEWDGSSETVIETWTSRPTKEEKIQALISTVDLNNLGPALNRLLVLIDQHTPETDKEAGHPFPWE